MRWIPLIVIFIITYIEISLFIQVAHVLGVLATLLLVIATSFIGVSLVRAQGLRILGQMQVKLARGESPAGEMIKSVSLLLAGFLLLLPGFFTDFLGLLLLLPPTQNLLTLRLLPYLRFQRGPGTGGDTFEGEYHRHDLPHDRLNDRRDDEK
ncbi:phage T7 F exclusion suppressor FxsA [Sodalis glossinidius str. 'morsitans']|uniref:Phage T7 F exclusion suppressor FxsA n=1 Tax=Sodalis glossinidius (strain morsitans) TaxID=343509 RepID=Q2NW96_SODGM|nr:FxsA family protein [Sodalis glossinidius]BAE73579.1 phage suppressor of F exclusion [Sodalis glossinidius str. 'morsitans']CRL43962.1 phage T7 F exclusion suppressor FxsA [Sodalis glossinidius str. 'morsitans']